MPIDQKAVAYVAQQTVYSVTEEANETLLTGPGFDELVDAHEVRAMAQATLDVLNGLARLEFADHSPVKLHGTIYQARPDGSRETIVHVGSARISIRGLPPTIEITGKDGQPLPSKPDPREQRFSKIDQTPQMMDAITAFAGPVTWQKLRYVFEVIKESAGGEGGIVQQGWAKKDEINDLKANITDKRLSGHEAVHGKSFAHAPVGAKMSVEQGTKFVGRLLSRWIDETELDVTKDGD